MSTQIIIPALFAIGSLCFLVGNLIAIWELLK